MLQDLQKTEGQGKAQVYERKKETYKGTTKCNPMFKQFEMVPEYRRIDGSQMFRFLETCIIPQSDLLPLGSKRDRVTVAV